MLNNPTFFSYAVDALFQAFCDGAVRNPDHEAEEEGQGNLFFSQDDAALVGDDEEYYEEQEDIGELVGGDPGRFDDAEEEQQEDGDGKEANGTA